MTATVLVVDDLETNVKLLEAKLLSEYYTVLTANSGYKALEVLAQNNIDIVLLDVMMPGMDGFETCRKIKNNPETMHIPVVMVTALSDIEDRVKGLEAGADEFLTKPVNDTPLFARVRSLSRTKSIIDELKLRNQTNAELGESLIELNDNFTDNKILLINDDVVQAKNLSNIITKISSNIQTITESKELDNIHYTPDLIIINCQLETEDPLRISVMLKSKESYRYTVIMLCAEEEDISLVVKGLELGASDYFIYPVDKSELIARIKTQLKRKQYQDNLRNALEQSVNLSIKDGLTGLFNRRYFDTHINKIITSTDNTHNKVCLMMFDIDHFKKVNDTYGHQAGDELLKKVAAILANSFRVTDLVARYGGEEFVVLLKSTNIQEASQIAERTRISVETADFPLPNQNLIIKNTISIGVTEYKPGEAAADFINRSDKSLYNSKETGRNKVSIV